MCTHLDSTGDKIEAEIKCRLTQLTEMHDFIKKQTSQRDQSELIMVMGDFNITATPLCEVSEKLVLANSN